MPRTREWMTLRHECELGRLTGSQQNPLAWTNYAVLNAACNVPITYMILPAD
jgi:hypothetical protein